MRSGIVVNVMDSDEAGATTYRLAADAINLGHEVWVIVLNDPNGLSKAVTKLHLQTFPESVRPRTLVTRSLSRIEAFLDDEGTVILKPLQGSGGAGVFIVRNDEEHSLEEIFGSVSRDGYVIAQQYLPAVGLDVVGDKLLEINVFSPGGFGSAQQFEKVNFTHAVLESLEHKVQYMQYYHRNVSNVELATL